MPRQIMVAATPDDAGRDAVTLAVELARLTGAGLVLAGVEPRGLLVELREGLERLRAAVPEEIPSKIDAMTSDSLVGGLHDLAVEHDAQLIVLGPSHRGSFARALSGDASADIVFTAPCGVAVAAGGQAAQAPQHIGVAWDGSEPADEALEWAVQLAEGSAAAVRIIRVHEDAGAEPDAELEAARSAAAARVTTEATVSSGDPADVLTQATQGLDLMVLGSRVHGPGRRFVSGSVSTELLHHAACPLVILPSGVLAAAA